MRAVDTNILVRFLTLDDPRQHALVLDFIKSNTIYINKTVLMELEWVLRFSYEFSPSQIAYGMEQLIDMQTAVFEDEQSVREALRLFVQGLDFGDAMHVASSFACEDIVTFDKAFYKKMSASPSQRVSLLK
jgi:predicted nucleic-acid-binding protein